MSIGRCAMQPAVAGSDASLRVGRIGDATRPDKSPANSKDQKGGLQSPTNASFLNGFRVSKTTGKSRLPYGSNLFKIKVYGFKISPNLAHCGTQAYEKAQDIKLAELGMRQNPFTLVFTKKKCLCSKPWCFLRC